MAEKEQGHTVSNEGEAVGDVSNSPVKRGRGRPQGTKKLKVCVTDVNMTELVSANSNGEPTQYRRGRGRPRLSGTKHTGQQRSGDDPASSPVQSHKGRGRPKGSKNRSTDRNSLATEQSSKRRGRPKKSAKAETAAAEDLLNGGSNAPKRGRPKGSKRKSEMSGEEEGSSVTPRKRGRPKGSLNKKPRLVSSEGERGLLPRRGRGRPTKSMEKRSVSLGSDGSQQVKRGRGRPKGSLNKKHSVYRRRGKVGRPSKISGLPGRGRKRGRPRQQPGKRGRPRKYPVPSPEELKKPKVWKPLGRPRKYPRVDPPEGALLTPRRGRGRPRKSDSKKGAHLRKNLPVSPSTPRNLSVEPQRKRGRPPSSVRNEDDAPRKRGRPKGSVNKNKVRSESQLDSTLPNHSKAASDSADVGLENEAELAAKKMEHSMETIPIKHGEETEETVIVQDVSFDISDQA